MNFTLTEVLMTVLILSSVFMSAIFMFYQKQGLSFVASFDKAIVWGIGVFVMGSSLSNITFLA